MAKKIIRYLLEGNGTIPVFVEHGGFYPSNEECVGLSVDEDVRHVPASVVRLTHEDLVARIIAVHLNAEGQVPTSEEAEEEAQSFYTRVGYSE